MQAVVFESLLGLLANTLWWHRVYYTTVLERLVMKPKPAIFFFFCKVEALVHHKVEAFENLEAARFSKISEAEALTPKKPASRSRLQPMSDHVYSIHVVRNSDLIWERWFLSAVSSGISFLLSTTLSVLLFAGMQLYRNQLAGREYMTIVGGFLGSILFILVLTVSFQEQDNFEGVFNLKIMRMGWKSYGITYRPREMGCLRK